MFNEARLLECVSFGTTCTPTWRTRRIPLKSGIVRRNAMRSRPLYRCTLLFNNLIQEDHDEIIAAFNASRGGVDSFRVKDWHDYRAVNVLLPVLGTGAPQQVQLAKLYTFGAQSVSRPLRKPVAGSFSMTANNAPLVGATVDVTTGIASFTAASSAVLRFTTEFDVPMYFEDDELPFSGVDKHSGELLLSGDVPLIEDMDV